MGYLHWPCVYRHGDRVLSEVTARIAEAQRRGYRELVLSDLRVASLPESVGNLTYLTRLDLSGNQLTKLPESLGNLTSLKEINLGDNQLTALPDSLGDLTSLIHLRVFGNRLTALPESLGYINLNRCQNGLPA